MRSTRLSRIRATWLDEWPYPRGAPCRAPRSRRFAHPRSRAGQAGVGRSAFVGGRCPRTLFGVRPFSSLRVMSLTALAFSIVGVFMPWATANAAIYGLHVPRQRGRVDLGPGQLLCAVLALVVLLSWWHLVATSRATGVGLFAAWLGALGLVAYRDRRHYFRAHPWALRSTSEWGCPSAVLQLSWALSAAWPTSRSSGPVPGPGPGRRRPQRCGPAASSRSV